MVRLDEDFCCASYVSFIVIVCARKELGCSYWRISIIGTLTNTCKEKKNSRLSFTISNASPPAAFATHLMQNCFKWLWWVLVFLTREKCDRWEIRVATENGRAEDEDNGSLLRSTKVRHNNKIVNIHFLAISSPKPHVPFPIKKKSLYCSQRTLQTSQFAASLRGGIIRRPVNSASSGETFWENVIFCYTATREYKNAIVIFV